MIRLVAAAAMWLSLAAVIVVAGWHTVHYLLIWEWVRAQIAGIAFVAALVVAATAALMSRMRRIEQRLDVLAATAAQPATMVRSTVDQQSVEPRPDFSWLTPPPGPSAAASTAAQHALAWPALAAVVLTGAGSLPVLGAARPAVFIPVFLATGLVVSVLAGAVERVSALRHRVPAQPVPAGGMPPAARTEALVVLRQRPLQLLVVLPLAAAAVVAALIGGLYFASHYRSEPLGAGITAFTVQVHVQRQGGPVTEPHEDVAAAGHYCSVETGIGVRLVDVRAEPGGAVLRVRPLLDEEAQRRYVGCLEDATLEQRWLEVTGVALDRGGAAVTRAD